jgi:hypothetical protein
MGRDGDCRIPKKDETTNDASADRTAHSNRVPVAGYVYFTFAFFFMFA